MRGSIGFTVAVLFALLAFTAPASAAPACGAVITTDTVLDGDIVCAGPTQQTGLFIGADDVTLWMAGHSITSTTPADAVWGIQGSYSRTDIRGNGSISGFQTGVNLSSGSDNSVRRLTVTLPSTGTNGINFAGDRSYAYRNVIDGSAAPYENGIYVAGTDAYVWGNTVTDSGVYGILTAGDNPRTPPQNPSRANVVLNTVSCSDNTSDGIYVYGYATLARVWQNNVTNCNRGIYAAPQGTGNGNGWFRLNVVTGNNTGLDINDKTAIIGRNVANGNLNIGISSSVAGPWGPRIRNNIANNNKNPANSNQGTGILAVTGTIDGGGNTATGNGIGTPGEQCVNVSCP